MLYNNQIDYSSTGTYIKVTAAKQKVSEDNLTVGNSYSSSYKLTETSQEHRRLQ